MNEEHFAPLLVVMGVRPHYVKAAALMFALQRKSGLAEHVQLIDARQQYDPELTDVVLDGVGVVPSVTIKHTSQNAHIRAGEIYAALCNRIDVIAHSVGRRPILVGFGDVTTTAMAAMAASRMSIPFVHVEAGVRSRPGVGGESVENKIRRVVAQASTINFCTLLDHVENLQRERAPGRAVWVGDLAQPFLRSVASEDVRQEDMVLCFIHKSDNVDPRSLAVLFRVLSACAYPVTFVLHPSAARELERDSALFSMVSSNIDLVRATNYSDFVSLMQRSRVIVTDSGDVQREAHYLGRRCVVRRDTVGWSELAAPGGHLRVGRSVAEIAKGIRELWDSPELRLQVEPGFVRPGGVDDAVRELVGLCRQVES